MTSFAIVVTIAARRAQEFRMQSRSARKPLGLSRYDGYDAAALVLLLALVVLVLLTFRSYGISNDEVVQQRYGELIIAYYSSGFTDRALFKLDNLYLYGGLFDVTATLIARALSADVYHVRHLLCAGFGIGGIVATWATARLIAGPRAGLMAALLLSVTGAWYGTMFNHTKDVTFAAAMMGAIYVLLLMARDLPRPRLRHVLAFGAMLGVALGLRATGLLIGGFLVIAIMLRLFDGSVTTGRDRLAFIGRSLLMLSPGLVLAYLVMIVAWPWAALDVFNPVRAVLAFSHFHYAIRDLLAGKVYLMDEMPRWYMPAYLAIKLPLLTFAGVVLALALAAAPRLFRLPSTPRLRVETALLVLVVGVPLTLQVIGRGPAFSGMRHFTFVVPPLAALGGIGLEALIVGLKGWRPPAAVAAGAAVAALLTWNATALARLHPHEYLYYNALVGGLPGAAGRYATDYWNNFLPEAVARLEAFVAQLDREGGGVRRSYNIAGCMEQVQFEHAASDRFRWTDVWEDAHFFVSTTHMACDNMLDGKVIVAVERQGVVIGVVKDRRAVIGQDAHQATRQ
jgi:hypothetical protein